MNILLLYGGISGEHAVSCVSASFIYTVLRGLGHLVFPVYIDKKNHWQLQDNQLAELENDWQKQKINPVIFCSDKKLLHQGQSVSVDFIFPIIHGSNGEDGSIQGLAQFFDLPYAGCSLMSSALGMHKKFMKQAFAAVKLPQTRYLSLTWAEYILDKNSAYERIAVALPFPVFCKPCNTGSSVGVFKIKSRDDFFEKIEKSFLYDDELVIERGHEVIELEISILGNMHGYEVSIIGEIVPNHEFYSYEAKYLDADGATMRVPAQLEEEQKLLIEDYARKAFSAIGGDGFARIDFFLDKQNGEIFINEINTLPGFTPISMFPRLWIESGRKIEDIISRILDLGLERQRAMAILHKNKIQ